MDNPSTLSTSGMASLYERPPESTLNDLPQGFTDSPMFAQLYSHLVACTNLGCSKSNQALAGLNHTICQITRGVVQTAIG